MSIKEKEHNKKKELFEKAKSLELYKKVLETFPDANLVDVILKDKKDE